MSIHFPIIFLFSPISPCNSLFLQIVFQKSIYFFLSHPSSHFSLHSKSLFPFQGYLSSPTVKFTYPQAILPASQAIHSHRSSELTFFTDIYALPHIQLFLYLLFTFKDLVSCFWSIFNF